VAGVRVRAPMMLIHTVAAGRRIDPAFRRGEIPGRPATPQAPIRGRPATGRGGPLSLTDANVMVGKSSYRNSFREFSDHTKTNHSMRIR